MTKTPSYSAGELTDMIHKAGIRPSAQRMAVLSLIANERSHPTADSIFSELAKDYPSLSLTTVYNSLHALTDAGLLRELEIERGVLHYDLAPQPRHSHFICRKCRRIFDMDIPDGLEGAASPGFRIESAELYFKGVCSDCMADDTCTE